ncbi:MAG: sigma-70 family RNA polymerase sigma factor [Lachnospiraceae bacterium]|nr:sigma-70 family RNA polymerase sigma factor [Lachnospiraceae bacterium]
MEDEEIIQLLWDRREQGLERLSEKYGKYCYSVSLRIVNNEEDAKECVNDTWFSAWNSIPPQKPYNLGGYLAKVVRNISINCYNKKNAIKRGGGNIDLALEELSGCVAGRSKAEERMELEFIANIIADFLNSQDKAKRWMFMQRYFFMADIKEISEKICIKEGTVKSTLCRMRKQLKKRLEKEAVYL